MSVISSLVAQPNRIIIASEFVHALGERGATMADVESMLSPQIPKRGQAGGQEEDADEKSGTTIARSVLNEMMRLRILERTHDDRLRISATLAATLPKSGWSDHLYDYLSRLLTDAQNAEEHGQGEVPAALCWLLQQSPMQPLGFSAGAHYNVLVGQVLEGDPLLTDVGNDARYQNLIYWARYLGLAERLSVKSAPEMVISDPTRAISRRLPRIFGDAEQLTTQAFLQRLGAEIPVVDGGRIWQDIQGRIKQPLQEKHISQATSLALQRLEHAGKIRLEGVSDASSWVLEKGHETKSVSHVMYLETPK